MNLILRSLCTGAIVAGTILSADAQTRRRSHSRRIMINSNTGVSTQKNTQQGAATSSNTTRPGATMVSGSSTQNTGTSTGKNTDSTQTTATNTANNGSSSGMFSGITNTDAGAALREALTIGAQNAGQKLNITNGFFGNALIKVLMPPEARQVEQTLRQWGMGSTVDKAILSMNRAAEDAAGKAAPIFIDAIRTITIQDGISILRGGQGAATNFLKTRTTAALTNAFRPVIQNSLGKTGATSLWGDVFKLYNQLPLGQSQVNTDLTGYVTERALNGLFVTIADEENKIRTNPAAQVTNLLQQVFGAFGR